MDEHEQASSEPTTPFERLGSDGGRQADQQAPQASQQTPPGYSVPPGQWTAAPMPPPAGRAGRPRQLLGSRVTAWVVAAALACAVVGLAVALTNTSPTTTAPVTARIPAGGIGPYGYFGTGPGRTRVGSPFGAGVIGTVNSVSASKFTMTTSAGQKLTVDEQSSTTYRKGASSASASAVTRGAHVLVLGSRSGLTVKATQVVIVPAGANVFGFSQPGPTSQPSVG